MVHPAPLPTQLPSFQAAGAHDLQRCSALRGLLIGWESEGAREPFTFGDLARHLGIEVWELLQLVQELLGDAFMTWFPSVVAGTAGAQVLPRQAVLLLGRALEALRERYVAPAEPVDVRRDFDGFIAVVKRHRVVSPASGAL